MGRGIGGGNLILDRLSPLASNGTAEEYSVVTTTLHTCLLAHDD